MNQLQAKLLIACWLLLAILAGPAVEPGRAEAPLAPAAAPSTPLEPFETMSPNSQASIAQASAQAADQLPIELAPVRLPERRSSSETFKSFETGALYRLPGRVFFNASVENSLRLETNVYQTAHRNRADLIYRPLPNVTLGYALTPTTRVATNYFFLRDQYARNDHQLSRNIQSVGSRIDHDIRLTRNVTATVGVFNRLLFVSHSRWLNDILPSVSVSRPVGYRGYVYGSVIGQLRWFDAFDTMQEGDVFYSAGGVYRRGPWIFSNDNTFITNFRKRQPAGPTNEMFVLTFEAARRVIPKVPLPVYAFVRAQPIFNIGANQVLGFAGCNFRLYGGLRMELSKPAIFPVKLAKL